MVLTGAQTMQMQETELVCTLYIVFPKLPLISLFDVFSSCLEWRYTYPLLEEAGFETWAIDILGWGFSDLGLFCDFSYLISSFSLYILVMLSSFFLIYHQKNFPHVMWYQSVNTCIRYMCFLINVFLDP